MERTSSSATANCGSPPSAVERGSVAEAVSHFPGAACRPRAATALVRAGNALAGFSATPVPELCCPLPELDSGAEPELDPELGSQRFPPGRPPPEPDPVPLPPPG